MKVGRDIPERVGRYEVLRPLGKGGMASVWLARYRVMDSVYRHVAIKAMHAHLRGEPEWLEAFLREARMAAAIEHPNVVSVIEVIDDALGVFLVMDYVAGPSLSQLIRRSSPPPKIAGRVLLDALEGLHAAHELAADGTSLGIVHRDFTPQNILVGQDGVAKLTDFGVAKMAAQATTGSLKGKLGYMAPEQLRGEVLDRRCDVWAAAVVIWELAMGRRMFAGQGEVAVLPEIGDRHFPMAQHDLAAPSELDALLQRTLATSRDQRPQTARELAEALAPLWKRTWGLASADEVARFVGATEEGESASRIAAAVTEPIDPPRPSRWPAALVLVAVGGLAAYFTIGPAASEGADPGEPARLPSTTPPPVPPATAESARAASATPSSSATASDPRPAELRVVSDVPLAALSVGTRVVDLPEPRREIVMAAPSQKARLVARSVDGRVRKVDVEPGQVEVALRFGPRPWRPAPAAKPPSGLHPM